MDDQISVADYHLLHESLRRRINVIAIADEIVKSMAGQAMVMPRPISGIGLELRQRDDGDGYSALVNRWQILKIRTSEVNATS